MSSGEIREGVEIAKRYLQTGGEILGEVAQQQTSIAETLDAAMAKILEARELLEIANAATPKLQEKCAEALGAFGAAEIQLLLTTEGTENPGALEAREATGRLNTIIDDADDNGMSIAGRIRMVTVKTSDALDQLIRSKADLRSASDTAHQLGDKLPFVAGYRSTRTDRIIGSLMGQNLPPNDPGLVQQAIDMLTTYQQSL